MEEKLYHIKNSRIVDRVIILKEKIECKLSCYFYEMKKKPFILLNLDLKKATFFPSN